MNPQERYDQVTQLMNGFFGAALAGRFNPTPELENKLNLIFQTKAWGFREILMVIVLARLLDPAYRASKAFYDCQPRALYEGPIRAGFLGRGVPHGKSGPLNVAKGARAINGEWAARRRPQHVAESLVSVVQTIERMSRADLRNFAVALHARFLEQARDVQELVVDARPESDPAHLLSLVEEMIRRAPDGGNTAQRSVGLMIAAYHETLDTGIVVAGHSDRASATTTTSKKAGDISEGTGDTRVIYEVTTKRFDDDRIHEAYQGARAFDAANHCVTSEIVVICRPVNVPDDLEENDTALYLGARAYRDLTFHFVDIEEWIAGQLLRMPAAARLNFYRALNDYLNEPSTSRDAKKLWRQLHEARVP